MMAWRIAGLALGVILGIVGAAQGLALPLWILMALVAIGAAFTAGGFIAERRWQPWPKIAIAVAALACAFPLGYLRTMDVIGPATEGSLRQVLADIEPGSRLHVRGVIVAEPELRGIGELDLYLRVHELRVGDDEDGEWIPVNRGRVLVRAFARASNTPETQEYFNLLSLPAAYGWELQVATWYRPIDPPLNPGTFDYANFLVQSGVDTRFRCHVSTIEVLEEGRGHPMMALALAAKTSFLESFKETVRAPASRLTAAATLGARRSVENIDYRGQDLATMLRHAGVGHVLAVSGLHVSVIAVMLFALFRLTGAKPKSFVPILILLLIMFAMLTGARPSSVRAVIMNSVILITLAYFRSDFRSATVIGLSLSSFFILMRNPTVLFAPSFLLSYGAVLSLIVIAPPLDRLICTLRGFALIFGAIWFAALLRFAGWHLHELVHPTNLLAMLGVLWLLISVGTRLNHRFPFMWSFNLERIPHLVRLFFAAQLAIQFGMMIPLSAWFFGQFPVAGVLVNLLAIPAVGVLVQLGMLTGLMGLIPLIGPWLTIPFGAATGLTGEAFIMLAYIGSSVFPYPATPMPSGLWMGGYYASLAAFLAMESRRMKLIGWFYRLVPPGPTNTLRRFAIAVPILLVAAPFLQSTPSEPELRDIRVLAEGRYPIVLLAGRDNATLINTGGRFAGGRLVFDSLRGVNATAVDTLILPSADPRAGLAGAAELVERMTVSRALLGTLPAPDQTLPEALGDDYLIRQAARGTGWAVNIEQGFELFRERAAEHGTELALLADEHLPVWGNGRMQVLPAPSEMPARFASSALTPVLYAELHGLEWVIITDTTPDALFDALANTTSCDVLVVPNLSNFSSYGRWLRTGLRRLSPRLLIIGGDSPVEMSELEGWLPPDDERILIQTGEEGAVTMRLRANGDTQIETYRGDTRLTLRPRKATE